MKVANDTINLIQYILKNDKFRRTLHLSDSGAGNYSRIGKIKSITNKKFLWKNYKEYEYFYEFEVIQNSNIIRVHKDDFNTFKSDLWEYIKNFENLTGYLVKIKVVDYFYTFG